MPVKEAWMRRRTTVVSYAILLVFVCGFGGGACAKSQPPVAVLTYRPGTEPIVRKAPHSGLYQIALVPDRQGARPRAQPKKFSLRKGETLGFAPEAAKRARA